ncbi:MAG: hypothetical protein ACRDTE_16020 [Pseudonocardiaceae bacterium]
MISGSVLTLLNLATCIPVSMALATPQPPGPGDTDMLDTVAIGSFFGIVLALLSLALTGTAISTGWLARWWLLIPATLLTAALVRLHALPAYP